MDVGQKSQTANQEIKISGWGQVLFKEVENSVYQELYIRKPPLAMTITGFKMEIKTELYFAVRSLYKGQDVICSTTCCRIQIHDSLK